jgi:hypothetical protein
MGTGGLNKIGTNNQPYFKFSNTTTPPPLLPDENSQNYEFTNIEMS